MNTTERQSTGTAALDSVSDNNAGGRLPDASCSGFPFLRATVQAVADGFEMLDVPVIVEESDSVMTLRLGGDINLSVCVGLRGGDSEKPDICVGVAERGINIRNTKARFGESSGNLGDPLLPPDPVAKAEGED